MVSNQIEPRAAGWRQPRGRTWPPGEPATRDAAATLDQVTETATPPSTDRGAEITTNADEPLTFRPDWLGITVKEPSLPLLGSQLANILFHGVLPGFQRCRLDNWDSVAEPLPHGARGYRTVYQLPHGVKLYCDPISDTYGDHLHIEIPGKVLDAAGVRAIKTLYGMLDGYFPGQWKHTRLDLAWDGVPFTPRQVLDAIVAGDVRTRAKREQVKWIESPLNEQEGRTCYLGSRKSERFLRVYDKRGPTRLELELKDKRAALVGRLLADAPLSEWSELALSHLRDFVDLVDHQAGENISRAPLLNWWADFVGRAQAARLKIVRNTLETIKQVKDWVRHAVAPTLALLLQASGGDLDELLDISREGKARWRKRHHVLLASAGIGGT